MQDGTSVKFEAHGDCIVINLINRPYPDSDDDWDRDAINATVTVNAGPFNGKLETTLWSHELKFLLKLLRSIDMNVGKETKETFRFREGTVQLTFGTTKKGNIRILCEVCENPADDTELTFAIEADQSYLPDWIKQTEMALQDFPLILKVRD